MERFREAVARPIRRHPFRWAIGLMALAYVTGSVAQEQGYNKAAIDGIKVGAATTSEGLKTAYNTSSEAIAAGYKASGIETGIKHSADTISDTNYAFWRSLTDGLRGTADKTEPGPR